LSAESSEVIVRSGSREFHPNQRGEVLATFKIQDLLVTLLPGGEACVGTRPTCFGGSGPCVRSSDPPHDEDIKNLSSDQLDALKRQLKEATVQVAKREKALAGKAKSAGKTVKGAELDELEKRLSGALADLRARKSNQTSPRKPGK
jgi:hypothetical protein